MGVSCDLSDLRLTSGPSPVCEVIVKLLLDHLSVTRVAVPGVVAIKGDDVKVLAGVVLLSKL